MVKKAIAVLLMVIAIYWSFSAITPSNISSIDAPNDTFSTHRALIHLKEISKQQHFLGSTAHAEVRNYILKTLQDIGLETQTQEGYAIDESGELSKPINILAKLKGRENGKALLLLTHYDSEPHSSYGASDAGTGVVTILEGLRAFIAQNKTPKNDILVLFSDSEEIGLNGADLFVNQHPWAKDIGLVLNFEARGSGGPSIMFMETNKGNANVIKAFAEADLKYPFGSSLFYSIYKMLPNDTDLTRFREDADIDGLNFAFIDDHYDYHTTLDNYERLDRESLEHQGSYLMPLLAYFSEADLSKLKSIDDQVYFNVPVFKMVTYPFSWILPMFILAVLIFIGLVAYGFKKRTLGLKPVGRGFVAFLITLVSCGLVGVFGWKLVLLIYPEYKEMLHGFTYNGHTYIGAFICLSIAICLLVYSKVYKPQNGASLMVAPLLFWLIICGGVAFALKGASFFSIPVFFGLLSFWVLLRRKQPKTIRMTLLSFPALTIFVPLIWLFPIGLGLKLLVATTVLLALVFGLLISVFHVFRHKKRWSYVFFFLAFCLLVSAHFKSDFTRQRPKPNSLVYVLNTDDNTAIWGTYDNVLDDWTAHFFDGKPSGTKEDAVFISKYSSRLRHIKKTGVVDIPQPIIEISNDTVISNEKSLEICITPQRNVHRIEVFADTSYVFHKLKLNGLEIGKDHKFKYNNRKTNRFITYYPTENEPLDVQLSMPAHQNLEFTVYESSYDLLNNDLFEIPQRHSHMIPKPFVLNDAVVVKKTVKID